MNKEYTGFYQPNPHTYSQTFRNWNPEELNKAEELYNNFINLQSKSYTFDNNILEELFLIKLSVDLPLDGKKLEEYMIGMKVFGVITDNIRQLLNPRDSKIWMEVLEGKEDAWGSNVRIGVIVNEGDGVVTWMANEGFFESYLIGDEEVLDNILHKSIIPNQYKLTGNNKDFNGIVVNDLRPDIISSDEDYYSHIYTQDKLKFNFSSTSTPNATC